ncbi:MAG: ThuA domain-containing protein [Dehalococcoidia bacterium]
MPVNVLLASKGHPFQRGPFFDMMDSFMKDGVAWTHVEAPASQLFYKYENAKPYNVIVDYSMQGVGFGRKAGDPAPLVPEEFKHDILDLMERGTHGFVFIHHHACSWPDWDEYANIVGGRFLYYPGMLRGQFWPDSGYLLGVESTYVVTNPDHPITQGLPPRFALQDELYLAPYFEDEVVPLIRSDFDFTDDNFFSPYQVVGNGKMFNRDDWKHPPASNMVCWAKNYKNSPVVYIQAGDVPTSYNNPAYRTLLSNAIKWVGSDEARQWARDRNAGKAVDPKETVTVTAKKQTWPWEWAEPKASDGRRCLFCHKDGVERYGGEFMMHTVAKSGAASLTGPLCGNCHPMLVNQKLDTRGWRLATA